MVSKKRKVERKSKDKNILIFMLVVSLLAVVDSSYLLYLHYSDIESFCDISESLSCDVVNKSEYSEFPPDSGFPVSFMGLLTFLLVFVVEILMLKNKSFKLSKYKIDKKFFADFLFYLMFASLLFALYLVYIELFVLFSVCILCAALDILIITTLLSAWKLRKIYS
ncbi:vitamin K epoxide reductase family protein [Candidatus Woesearchaeota archaeon]|nr:vitamin K epoxide reductase family protein [Candidatus Woesearchaeota archaeon]